MSTSLLPSFRGLASRLLSRPFAFTSTLALTQQCRALSTTSSTQAPPGAQTKAEKKEREKKKKGRGEQQRDPKIINMLKHFAVLSPRRIPPPLRMGRNRYLRHWTIHRAWMLWLRKQREERERNWMRQWQSMYAACEELRLTSGPGTREEGYLYRVAMEKKGVYGLNPIPIEYARPQVETPPKQAWNHDWKR
ncbi:mitochondrial 54S ribosomal protein mL40 [Thermochaetoides thermophila DSM 1495]|uniref:Large ribosomal subunit protein mL40 n=1 Tax=Chaetomium thermophilum (strain DSM 1495 / CBS 144.50 / IMI 039719) TaxID=759272 RepID=G0S4K0_CHATD|nr:hypothetical protein CTHT_0031280 [Thermochaetoides thermophila DSM 1495]EGS21275.1 hypothetical protein CTHT_0031280 [Thermochaetoides thermophila DSM 1495]